MRILRQNLQLVPYQEVELPTASAPVRVAQGRDDPSTIDLWFIDAEGESGTEGTTKFGIYILATGEKFPPELRIQPKVSVLLGQVEPPNALYVGTVVKDSGFVWHLILSQPR